MDWLLVFLCGFVIEWLDVHWIYRIQNKDPLASAILAVVAIALLLTGVVEIVSSNILAVPFLLGAGLGTYSAVWREKTRDASDPKS